MKFVFVAVSVPALRQVREFERGIGRDGRRGNLRWSVLCGWQGSTVSSGVGEAAGGGTDGGCGGDRYDGSVGEAAGDGESGAGTV